MNFFRATATGFVWGSVPFLAWVISKNMGTDDGRTAFLLFIVCIAGFVAATIATHAIWRE